MATVDEKFHSGLNLTILPDEIRRIERIIQQQLKDVLWTINLRYQDPLFAKVAPTVSIEGNTFCMRYSHPLKDKFSYDEVIPILFENFNISLDEIDKQILRTGWHQREKITVLARRKLALIAHLYQDLEWFHPFPDGQGRTDLILLAKLLSENGFTPAILNDPYMSSFSSGEDRIAYLEEVMEKWQKEAPPEILNEDVQLFVQPKSECCSII